MRTGDGGLRERLPTAVRKILCLRILADPRYPDQDIRLI
jgi:hypothetical protein